MASTIERALSPVPVPLSEELEEPVEVEVVGDGPIAPELPEEPAVEHGANLAELIDEDDLRKIASELIEDFERDKSSRDPWEAAYVKGVKLLGLEIEERTEPWAGASGVFHPILTEAVIRFQAESITETFPASGPVQTSIVGKETPEKRKQAKRVKDDMNYHTVEVMPEYRKEHERLLLNLGMSGSAFKKIYYDPVTQRPTSLFVPADDFVVSYGATDLASCPRYTHVLKEYKNDIVKMMYAGMYRMTELNDPSPQYSDVEKEEQKNAGYKAQLEYDKRHTLLEMHVDYDLSDYLPDEDADYALPYIITICKDDQTVLSIYRNWREESPTREKEEFFVPYEYVPGLGFYGIGLIHLLGSIAKSATSILRQLSDAGTLANLPGGLKSRGLRIKGDDSPIRPGEWRDVDVPSGAVKDNLMPLPYKEPSAVLYQLLGSIVQEGRTVASIADMKISDMNNQAPVGTTLAIIERGMKVMSAVNARIHASMRKELKMLAGLVKRHARSEYEYETDPGSSRAKDYDDRVDILPVSNPNASTLAQRIMQYQAALQLAQSAPEIYNRRELHRQMIDVLGLMNAEKIVPLESDMKPTDPVSENMALITGKPTKAFPDQDHEAHITVHMAAIEDPKIQEMLQKSPAAEAIGAAAAAHVQEHVAFQYRREIEEQLGVAMPGVDQELPPEVEASLSKLVQDASQKLLQKDKEEMANKQAVEAMGDPLIQIQQREVEAKVAEVERKARADELRAETAQAQIDSKEKIEGAKLGVEIVTAARDAAMADNLEDAKLAANMLMKLIDAASKDTNQERNQNKSEQNS